MKSGDQLTGLEKILRESAALSNGIELICGIDEQVTEETRNLYLDDGSIIQVSTQDILRITWHEQNILKCSGKSARVIIRNDAEGILIQNVKFGLDIKTPQARETNACPGPDWTPCGLNGCCAPGKRCRSGSCV